MGKKYTYEGLKERSDKLDLEIVKFNKLGKSVLKDKDGYLYFMSSDNLKVTIRRNGVLARYFSHNPFTRYNIMNYLKINNTNISLVTSNLKGITAIEDITFNCPIHGEFQHSWNNTKNGQYCITCGKIKGIDVRKNDYKYVKQGFEKEGYIFISTEYISNQKPLEYICPNHKTEGIQKLSWAGFIMGQRCLYCTKEETLRKVTKSQEQFEKEVREVHGDKFKILTPYLGCKYKMKFYCNDCKIEFEQAPNHLLEGHIGCACFSKSLGEDKIREILTNKKIFNSEQYRIKKCKNKRPLPFDFVVFKDKEKTIIDFLVEFQGRQHYAPSAFGSMTKEQAKQRFIEQQLCDNIKFNYCKDNDIELIIIPYWKFGNIEKILDKELTN